MKKKYIIILSFILLIFIVSSASAGFFDGIFEGISPENNDKNQEFIDSGTSSGWSNDWYILPNVTKSVLDNGTLIISEGDHGIYANKPNTSIDKWEDLYDWSSPFVVEFDVLEYNGTVAIRISNDTVDFSKLFNELGIKNGSHVKINSTEESLTYTIDGNSLAPINKTTTNSQIGFRLVNASLMYKNFTIH